MIGFIVKSQADVFLISIIYGALLAFIYDIVRLFRKIVKHNNIALAIEDFIYWMFFACEVISMIYTYNNGSLRSYVVLGLIIGCGIYFAIVSIFFRKFIQILIKPIKKMSKRQ